MFGNSNYYFQGDFYLTNDQNNIIYVGNYYTNHSRYINIGQLFGNSATGKLYLPISSDRSDFRDTNNTILNYNIASGTITELTLQGDTNFTSSDNKTYSCKEFDGYFVATNGYSGSSFTWDATRTNLYNYLNWENNNSKQVQLKEVITSIYIPVKSQLNATNDYVYEKIFYGKDGVENGTLTTNVSDLFADVNAEVYTKLQQTYDTMQPKILTDRDKAINKNIYFIPTNNNNETLLDISNISDCSYLFTECRNLKYVPTLDLASATNAAGMFYGDENLVQVDELLHTENITNMELMFQFCSGLESVPVINASSATNMVGMFDTTDNSSLSNDSLNNIMQTCITATNITGTTTFYSDGHSYTYPNKSLRYVGLSQAQAQICTTLSNYQAFVNAGWTTGY